MKQFGIGQPVRRVEDRRFITGRGSYLDDLSLPRQVWAYMLRSPHAHARIRGIDIAAAIGAPGVLAAFAGEDLARDGIGSIPCLSALTSRDGSPCVMPLHPAIARDRVRHVGDTVALVVAESLAAARDAAELVAVDYEPLPAAVDTARALEVRQPQVWEAAPGNLCFDWEVGDGARRSFPSPRRCRRRPPSRSRDCPVPRPIPAAVPARETAPCRPRREAARN